MTAAPPNRCYTSLTADESALLLTQKLQAQEPFFFVRYGDGALECIAGKYGMTCDLEQYSADLGFQLQWAFETLMRGALGSKVYVGDWLSASFDAGSEHARYAKQYAELIGSGTPEFVHFEALLLMRESLPLLDFYKAVKVDTRRKLYMGPLENESAAKMLGAEFLPTPMRDLFRFSEIYGKALVDREFDILLYGAGMAGNLPVVKCWQQYPGRTYINLGSALDVLFQGHKTRRQQLSPAVARRLFQELL